MFYLHEILYIYLSLSKQTSFICLFLQVDFTVPLIDICLSPTVYSVIVNLPRVEESKLVGNNIFNNANTHDRNKPALNMSASLKVAKLLGRVDLDDNYNESSVVTLGAEDIDIRLIIDY